MGFFRRGSRATAATEWTVGVNNHRVVLGGSLSGVTMLAQLRAYVASVTGGAALPIDGRDPVAVLSAKMDQAELVNDACGAASLALDDLVERGVVQPSEIPPEPELPPVPPRGRHYDYIQAAHRRALVRLDWLEACSRVLDRHGVALLDPRPDEDPSLHPGGR